MANSRSRVATSSADVASSSTRIRGRRINARAMQHACRATGRWSPEFLFVPCTDRRYRVVIDGTAAGAAQDGFAAELEGQLRRAARGYDFEREDGLLEPLEVIVTAPGELRDWLERRQGGPRLANAQIKPQHLTNQFDAHTSFHAVATRAA